MLATYLLLEVVKRLLGSEPDLSQAGRGISMVDEFLDLVAPWRLDLDRYCHQTIERGVRDVDTVIDGVQALAREGLARETRLTRELGYDRHKLYHAQRRCDGIVRAMEACPRGARVYVQEHLGPAHLPVEKHVGPATRPQRWRPMAAVTALGVSEDR
jgi:hypothetical protein